jgi:hypothetical protein
MRKRLDKKRRRSIKNIAQTPDESAGQQLSPEEQEKAALKRLMAEMGHRGGHKGGKTRAARPGPGRGPRYQ